MLNVRPYKEHDRFVNIYTKDFGRLEAKVTGGRKILSKLSPHLDPGNLVRVRIVGKAQFTLADALAEAKFSNSKNSLFKNASILKLLFLIRSVVPESVPDLPLWHFLLRSLSGYKFDFRNLLRLLGYNPIMAECDFCGNKNINHFYIQEQSFLCEKCSLKLTPGELIFIG